MTAGWAKNCDFGENIYAFYNKQKINIAFGLFCNDSMNYFWFYLIILVHLIF